MLIASGSSNLKLAESIATRLNAPLVAVEIQKFANGEKRVWIKGAIRGQNITLVQSFSDPADEHIIETLLIVDALERQGARNVNLVLPWMGYSLQDKVFRPGEPIAAKVVANLVSSTYIKRAFLLDLHNSSIPGFFAIPTEHLTMIDMFVEYCRSHFDLHEVVVASPDFGGLKRARVFADKLGVELINFDKKRNLSTGEVEIVNLHGHAKDKVVLTFDDVIVSGGTVTEIAQVLRASGAKAAHFLATHALFANNALAKINHSAIDSIITSNSIDHPEPSPKVVELDTAPVFADALRNWF